MVQLSARQQQELKRYLKAADGLPAQVLECAALTLLSGVHVAYAVEAGFLSPDEAASETNRVAGLINTALDSHAKQIKANLGKQIPVHVHANDAAEGVDHLMGDNFAKMMEVMEEEPFENCEAAGLSLLVGTWVAMRMRDGLLASEEHAEIEATAAYDAVDALLCERTDVLARQARERN